MGLTIRPIGVIFHPFLSETLDGVTRDMSGAWTHTARLRFFVGGAGSAASSFAILERGNNIELQIDEERSM